MNNNQRINAINRISKLIDRYTSINSELSKLIGIDYDSALLNLMDDAIDTAIEFTAVVIGDKDGWLSWYTKENDCGRSTQSALWIVKDGKHMTHRVRNAKDLLLVIDGKIK